LQEAIFDDYQPDSIMLCGDNWLAKSLLTLALNLLGFRSRSCFVEPWHRILNMSVGEPMATLILLPASAWARVVPADFRHFRSL
jgi:hypothetical protein